MDYTKYTVELLVKELTLLVGIARLALPESAYFVMQSTERSANELRRRGIDPTLYLTNQR